MPKLMKLHDDLMLFLIGSPKTKRKQLISCLPGHLASPNQILHNSRMEKLFSYCYLLQVTK